MTSYRYSRWDGIQDVPTFNEDALMEQLSDQLLSHGDLSSAIRSLIQRGARDSNGHKLAGVQELLQRLRTQRQVILNKYDLISVVGDISKRLEDIVDTERRGIEGRLREVRKRAQSADSSVEIPQEELIHLMERMARRNREYLDSLPQEPLEAIKQLRDYEFMDGEAKEKFDQLLKELQKRVIDSHFKDMSRHLQSMTPEELRGLKDMLGSLNRMLDNRLQGDASAFQRFMERYGHLWDSDPPSSLDELMEGLQQQADQMSALLNSMSQEMRQELKDLLDEALIDRELQQEMASLGSHLNQPDAQRHRSRGHSFQGRDPVTMKEALDLIERLSVMERLEKQLRKIQHGESLSDIEEQLLKEVLGEEGYIRMSGSRFELTLRGMRKIGQKALQEIFFLIKRDHIGTHRTSVLGTGGEHQEDTKRYEFGDPFNPHLQKSLMNAIARDFTGIPVNLRGEDFEVYRPEQVSQASTVLMIDLSLSMAMRGNFVAAKKVALALDCLIRTQFPRDNLCIVGFSTYAREVKSEGLSSLNWDELDPYTNIQHGLVLARKLLSRTPLGTKQIILISDGEPTAHMEGGQLFVQYPPSPRTIMETLKEVKRCTHMGILINTFALDRNTCLVDFVDQMTRINRGRVFYTSPDQLGQYILVDYFTNRHRAGPPPSAGSVQALHPQ